MKKITIVSKEPLCVVVDPTSDLIDAGSAVAAKRKQDGAEKTKRLGDLVDHSTGGVNPHSPKHENTTFQYIDLAEVDEVMGSIMTYRQLLGRQIGSNKVRFQRGDLLFAKIRPSIDNKKVAYVFQELENPVASTEFLVLRARAAVDALYLFAALRSDEFTDAVIRECGGDTGRQRIAPAKLLEIPIPWPEEDLRKEVAANVKAYFDALATTMALRQQSTEIGAEALGPSSLRTTQPRRQRTKK